MRIFRIRAMLPVAVAAALVTVTAVPASAESFVPCNSSNTRVCYEELGPVGPPVPLFQVVHGTSLATVAATLDIYAIPFGAGSVQIPCITPVVNGVPADACARLGFTLISSTPLISDDVDQQLEPSGAIYACNANLTVLVNNIGLNNFPIVSVCQNGIAVSA